jgi:thiamine transport system substrate-binding protein
MFHRFFMSSERSQHRGSSHRPRSDRPLFSRFGARRHAHRDTGRSAAAAVLAGVFAIALLVAPVTDLAAGGRSESTPSAESDQLVVWTYDAFPEALEELLTAYMRDEHGVTTVFERYSDTGGLYNEVLLTAGEGLADLVIGLDNTYIGAALSSDLFQPWQPTAATAIRPELILDDSYRLVPFDWGNIVLNYDSEALPDPPRTWEDLLDPALEESIILTSPATSSPGRNFLLLTVAQFGEEGFLEYWEALKPNILTVTAGWSEGYGLYSQGEAPIVLSYDTSPAYHIAYEDTDRYRTLILDDVGYAQIEVMGILADAPNPEHARRAAEFVLSTTFQQEIPLNQFMYPVRDDAELPEAFTLVERPGESVFLDPARVDANFDSWLAEWEEVMR